MYFGIQFNFHALIPLILFWRLGRAANMFEMLEKIMLLGNIRDSYVTELLEKNWKYCSGGTGNWKCWWEEWEFGNWIIAELMNWMIPKSFNWKLQIHHQSSSQQLHDHLLQVKNFTAYIKLVHLQLTNLLLQHRLLSINRRFTTSCGRLISCSHKSHFLFVLIKLTSQNIVFNILF